MTLEQLKALSHEELHEMWRSGQFPFEFAKCGHCVTTHGTLGYIAELEAAGEVSNMEQFRSIWKCGHHEFSRQARPVINILQLRENLEQIYALRLYFADLYQNPVPADALEAEVTPQPEPILT